MAAVVPSKLPNISGKRTLDDRVDSQRSKKARVFTETLKDDQERLKLEGGSQGILGDQKWPRPDLPNGWDSQDITFQQIDAEESRANSANRNSNSVIVRLFGVTANGNSVMCDILNFRHYLYIAAPFRFTEKNVPELLQHLSKMGLGGLERVEIEMKQSLWGYYGDDKVPFLKLVCWDPRQVTKIRSYFEHSESGVTVGDFHFGNQTYDNLSYSMRCAVDCGIVGMSWMTLPKGKYELVQSDERDSKCQIEVTIDYKDLVAHPPNDEWLNSAPLRVMSFDIECSGRKGIFPDANVDPVIQIASVVQIQGASRPFVRVVFTLGTCSPIIGSEVYEHKTEEELLLHWSSFVNTVDPDVMIGYNTTNFDFPYLIDRAVKLNIQNQFAYFGRLRHVQQVLSTSTFSSKAYGTSESKVTNIEGRLQIDMLQYIRRDRKLRSYTLNAVSAEFLGEQKEDVHHSIISELQNGNADSRYRLAVYCLKDAYLPLRLLDKLMAFVNMTEMARVTGVPLGYLLTRGQQIKVISQLFRKAREVGMVIPNLKQEGGSDEQYEGATVIEPIRGYYDKPIATLDFSSLYPSIMMAHNLCYTTLLTQKQATDMNLKEGQDYVVTPNGDLFVTKSKRHGLLPVILDELLSARKRAKTDLKNEKDPFKRAVLDGRQLALKVSANSVYGFTGATIGKLPCLAISSSVTSYGRCMIEATKELVEKHYTKAHGYEHDSLVIYGDTDSVMVKFGVSTLEEAMKLGEEAANLVSQTFLKPIKLEFEKVYFPYLLINKKRYAGLYWTNPKKHDKMDTKGIETVRRDNCRLVQNVIDTVLNRILIDRDVNAAQEFVKSTIADLLQNKVDLSLLIISKQLSRTDYAGKQAHSELAQRMRQRDPGSAPSLGDRVPYVIIQGKSTDKNYDKSEDPVYVLEKNLPIDTNYYLENQLSKPLLRIFEPILGEKASSLLSGEHTRKRIKATPTTNALSKFTVKSALCKGCKRPLSGPYVKGAVCQNCLHKVPDLYAEEVEEVNELQIRFAKLWTECQSCQHSMLNDVICSSDDCPIFFMRRGVQKELDRHQAELARFDSSW